MRITCAQVELEETSVKHFNTGAGAFGNNIQKEPQKPRLKLKKYVYYIFTENIYSACSRVPVVVFCKNVLILQNNDPNFLTLKVV